MLIKEHFRNQKKALGKERKFPIFPPAEEDAGTERG